MLSTSQEPSLQVLLVEGDPATATRLRGLVAEADPRIKLIHAGGLAEALERLSGARFDAALVDLEVQDSPGLPSFVRLHASEPEMPIVVLADAADEALALKAVASGARDYLIREDLTGVLLARALLHAIERHRTDRELRAQAEAYRMVFETAPIGIANLAPDGAVIRCNRALEEMLGFGEGEMVGINTSAITHPDDLATTLDGLARLRAGELDSIRMEKRYLRRDGTPVWATVGTTAVRHRDGTLQYAISMIENVTERRASERAMRESEERFRSLSTCSPVGIFMTDLQGWITYLNPRMEEICGFAAAEGLGDGWTRYLHPGPRDRVLACWRDSIASGQEFQERVRWLHPAEGDRWTQVRAAPLSSDVGTPIGYVGTVEDITERMQVERALQTSEQYFRALIEHAHDIIVVLDHAGRISYTSPSIERVLDFAPAEVAGRSVFEFIHPDDVPKMQASFAHRSTADGRGRFVEFRLRARDGSWRVLEEVGTNLFGDPAVGGMVINARDITQRKQADAALAAAEAHYRRLVQTSPVVIFGLDATGRFNEINPAGEAMLGLPAEKILGSEVYDYIAEEYRDDARALFESSFASRQERIETDVTLVHSSGERRVFRVDATTIREGEQVSGLHGVARDVTDDYRRERQMRLLATALEGLREEGVCVLDAQGKYLYANSAHARLLGHDPDALSSLRLDDFLPDEEARREVAAVYAELETRDSWNGRVRRKRLDDGQVLTVEMTVSRVQDGTRTRYFTILQDATDKIGRERQLRRAERLASVGTLVSGVAHELNNPLHAIANFADLMLLEDRNEDDREALDIIHREARRAAHIVNDLRLLARRSQADESERGRVDVNDVVRHILKTRQYTLDTRNIQVVEDLRAAPATIMADEAQLEQVLLNLIVNAEQAMDGQERARVLTVRSRHIGGSIVVSVSDTGCGIARDNLERVFDPFWTTKPPGQGTGLGLSLVHSIVTEHEGTVRVESREGEGTEFFLRFPTAPEPQDESAVAVEGAKVDRPLRVLIMDDEPANRRVLVRYLSKRGHQVVEASNGAEALEMIAQEGFDIVVSDVRMPGMGGIEFLERLRSEHADMVGRLLFVTGDTNSPEVSRIATEHQVPVLFKPVSLPVLASAIEQRA